jgi:hypothetical protein
VIGIGNNTFVRDTGRTARHQHIVVNNLRIGTRMSMQAHDPVRLAWAGFVWRRNTCFV